MQRSGLESLWWLPAATQIQTPAISPQLSSRERLQWAPRPARIRDRHFQIAAAVPICELRDRMLNLQALVAVRDQRRFPTHPWRVHTSAGQRHWY